MRTAMRAKPAAYNERLAGKAWERGYTHTLSHTHTLQEGGVIPDLISAENVVKALVQDQPLAHCEGDYNLEIKASCVS